MITEYREVVLVGGQLWNLGKWDTQERQEEVVNRPFPGPLEAPDGWDYQITYRTVETNPLPEGAVTTFEEVFFDREGSLRLVSQAGELELETLRVSRTVELRDLMDAVNLGIATDAERARAIELRALLK